MRGDLSRATPYAVELARLAREHDLPSFRALGVFLERLATADSGAPADRLEDMRRGIDLRRRTERFGVRRAIEDCAWRKPRRRQATCERALAILDEALATCGRTGHRAFEAELRRARGELLADARSRGSRVRRKKTSGPQSLSLSVKAARTFGSARRSFARKTLPIDRPPDRGARRPRARARRLFANAGNAGDRRGAGAAGDAQARNPSPVGRGAEVRGF